MHGCRLAMVGALALIAAACGSDASTATTTASTIVPISTVSTTTAVPTPTTAPVPTTIPEPASTAAPVPLTTDLPQLQPCPAAAIDVTEQPTEGAMGSIYTPLTVTNTGSVSCIVSTHVVLVFVDSSGHGVGNPVATSELAGPGLMTLAPSESRYSFIRYSQPANMDCQPLDTPTTAELTFNQTEVLQLPSAVWPLCTDRLTEQVSLGDLEVASP